MLVACRDYRAGATLRDLAARYGVSTKTVARALRQHGVVVRPAGCRRGVPSSEDAQLVSASSRVRAVIDDVVWQYRAGATLAALAERYEVSSSSIRRALEERGVKIRARGRAREGGSDAE